MICSICIGSVSVTHEENCVLSFLVHAFAGSLALSKRSNRLKGFTDVQAQAPSSQPTAPAQQVLVAQKPRELSWGQKLLGLGVIVAAGAGAGVVTKVCIPWLN